MNCLTTVNICLTNYNKCHLGCLTFSGSTNAQVKILRWLECSYHVQFIPGPYIFSGEYYMGCFTVTPSMTLACKI